MAEIESASTLLDDVKKFTESRWKHHECEICGIESWLLYPDMIAYVRIPISGEDTTPQLLPPPSRGALPLTCQNCGNIRLIDIEVFHRWRSEQKVKTTKSSS